MKKSCSYCGRIHERGYRCEKKPVPKKKWSNKNKFRSSSAWQKKREEIKERDRYVCRACYYSGRVTTKSLEVHHIIPLEESYALRLEDANLITLCQHHHERAEEGSISKARLRHMIPEDKS